MSATPVDLLVRHAYVITLDEDRHLFEDGAIAVAGRRIVDVGEDALVSARYGSPRTIDAAGAPVHPGLIESHLHASYQLYRGAVADHVSEDDDAIDESAGVTPARNDALGTKRVKLRVCRCRRPS